MSELFSPIELGPLKLNNRLVVAPMAQYSAEDGAHGQWHKAHLGGLANSGAGLVMIEMTSPTAEGRCSHGDCGLYDDRTESALAETVALLRAVGPARVGVQIGHGGRKAAMQVPWNGGLALTSAEGAWPTMAPSPLALGSGPIPREMEPKDIRALIDAHAQAAARAVRAGIDLIEIHAAHGYLLHQFHSPVTNKRTDDYGGNSENRMRLLIEVLQATRAAAPEVAVGMRITASDWIEGGLVPQDAVALARSLEAAGCDYVDVTSGGIDPAQKVEVGPLYQVDFAATVKSATSMPVRAVGMIATPEQAEDVIASGKADMVALARAFLANPRWGWWAAYRLGASPSLPVQAQRAGHPAWAGWQMADPALKVC